VSHSLKIEGPNMNKRRNVAIVDDDEPHRLATEGFVLSLGLDVLVFASPEEYLRSENLGDTSFLISDVRMPGMSGIEMHKRLVDMGFTPPTIFITGFSTVTLKAEVMASGALTLLEKPFDSAVLAQWLNLSLGQP
jgi:FixJ family two-component response regulator